MWQSLIARSAGGGHGVRPAAMCLGKSATLSCQALVRRITTSTYTNDLVPSNSLKFVLIAVTISHIVTWLTPTRNPDGITPRSAELLCWNWLRQAPTFNQVCHTAKRRTCPYLQLMLWPEYLDICETIHNILHFHYVNKHTFLTPKKIG